MATRTISDAGGNWTTTGAWVEGVVPTAADDVVCTATSATTVPISITAGSVCRSLDLTGFTRTLTSVSTLTIGHSTAGPGDVILKVPPSGGSISFGAVTLVTTAPTQQTISAGRALSSVTMTINSPGGSLLLLTDLNLTSGALTVSAGTVDFNGKTLSMNAITSTGSIVRSLIFGAATVNLSVTGTAWNITGTNVTVSAASATFTMGSNSGFAGAGNTYGTVRWTNMSNSSTPNITGNNTFGTLSIRTSTTIDSEFHIQSNSTQTVTGLFELVGTPGFRLMIGTGATTALAFSSGVTATINVGAATVTLAHVSLMDIALVGAGAPYGGTRVGNAGGNSGITFDASRTLYWVGNSGTWIDATNLHWALTSGGAPGPGVLHPLPQDDVIIDDNSFSSHTGYTISVQMTWMCRNFTTTTSWGFSRTSGLAQLTVFGSITLGGSGGFVIQNSSIYCRGRGAYTVTPNISGQVSSSASNLFVVVAPSGSMTLTTDWINPQLQLRVYGGIFDAGGHDVTLQNFSGSSPAGWGNPVRELRMGSGQWTLINAVAPGWQNDNTGNQFTLIKGTATLRVTGSPATVATVTAANQNMPALTIDLVAGKTASVSGGGFSDIIHVSGTIDIPGTTTCSSFLSAGHQIRVINVVAGFQMNVTGPSIFSGTNLTFTAASTSVWQVTPTAVETDVHTNGVTFGTFRAHPPAGGEITVYGALNTTNFYTTGPATGTGVVSLNEPVLVTGTYQATGNNVTNRIRVYGPPWGGRTPISAAITSLINVDLINIDQAGAAAWTGTSKTNTFTGYTNQAIEV